MYQLAFDGYKACAPSALLSALRYLEPGTWQEADPEDFDAAVRRHAQRDTSQGILAQAPFQAFTYAGVTGRVVSSDLGELREELERGTPVTVRIHAGSASHVIALLPAPEDTELWLVSDPASIRPAYWTSEELEARLIKEGPSGNHAVALVSRSQAIANCRENPKWCRFAPLGYLNEAWVMR